MNGATAKRGTDHLTQQNLLISYFNKLHATCQVR